MYESSHHIEPTFEPIELGAIQHRLDRLHALWTDHLRRGAPVNPRTASCVHGRIQPEVSPFREGTTTVVVAPAGDHLCTLGRALLRVSASAPAAFRAELDRRLDRIGACDDFAALEDIVCAGDLTRGSELCAPFVVDAALGFNLIQFPFSGTGDEGEPFDATVYAGPHRLVDHEVIVISTEPRLSALELEVNDLVYECPGGLSPDAMRWAFIGAIARTAANITRVATRAVARGAAGQVGRTLAQQATVLQQGAADAAGVGEAAEATATAVDTAEVMELMTITVIAGPREDAPMQWTSSRDFLKRERMTSEELLAIRCELLQRGA